MLIPYSGKLLREKTLQIGEKYDFRRENFRRLFAFAVPKMPCLRILVRKLLQIASLLDRLVGWLVSVLIIVNTFTLIL